MQMYYAVCTIEIEPLEYRLLAHFTTPPVMKWACKIQILGFQDKYLFYVSVVIVDKS